MAWKKYKKRPPMEWAWDQAIVEPEKVAETKAQFAADGWMFKGDPLVLQDGRVLIVVSRGTKIETEDTEDEPTPKKAAKKAPKPTAPNTEGE